MNISPSSTPLFAALHPDDRFDEKLRALKGRVLSLVGPQLFLDHPPHLTLYLAGFRSEEGVTAEIERWIDRAESPQLSVVGWHVFRADALTGNHSLVCELRLEDEERLRLYQEKFIGRIAPLRDAAASTARFEPSRNRLSPTEWKSVENCGFPYVGELWKPHFTVASIRPGDWEAVWSALKGLAPAGAVNCPTLGLYRLRGEHPEPVRTFRLKESP
ncbi:MAG: 2'-5' RNA ligase family protein [Armatimonadota bacterium]|nr:2'-5' RNA ligase family protein [Armatimonadota bacterium]